MASYAEQIRRPLRGGGGFEPRSGQVEQPQWRRQTNRLAYGGFLVSTTTGIRSHNLGASFLATISGH